MSSPSAAEISRPVSAGGVPEGTVNLVVQGFIPAELQLLDAIVQLSQRRQPHLNRLDTANAEQADVVMIDYRDRDAMKWAESQAWLSDKTVIWVDAPAVGGRTTMQRPISWPSLPKILSRTLAQRTQPTPPQTETKGEVLIVDDSTAVRGQIRALLEAAGLKVSEVDNAEAAISAATNKAYSCILLDVLMPGMDGYEACRTIKANTRSGTAPAIVMLTSKTSPFDRIRGKMAGCDAYLTKPVEPVKLTEVIMDFVEKAPAQDEACPIETALVQR